MAYFEQIALDNLQRQFGYTNVAALMSERAKLYDKYVGNLSETFGRDILDYNICVPSALDYFWGRLFKISRTFEGEDGQTFTLNDEQFREIIKIRAFGTTWDGATESINTFLGELFKDRGLAYMIDPQNMTTVIFAFNFVLEDWELYLFKNKDVLPRPAGVGTEINIFDTPDKYFGFADNIGLIESPITVGFGTNEGNPTGNGKFATNEDRF